MKNDILFPGESYFQEETKTHLMGPASIPTETSTEDKFDLILFSYSLSMMNPGWEQAIESAYHDLNPGGRIAVVDFHDSNWPLFKWLMRFDVRLNGHLLPKLQAYFQTRSLDVRPAYGGFWHYLLFVGVKHS